MRLVVFLAGAVLFVTVASHPMSAPTNYTSAIDGPKNSTYGPFPPSSQDPTSSQPTRSGWSFYHTGGLILFILSVSVGIWRRYQTEITAIFMYVIQSIQSTFGRKPAHVVNITHPNPTLNAVHQEAEIARLRPVLYNPSRVPVYHTNPPYMPPPRYTQRQQPPYTHAARPSDRVPLRRTYPISAFEEDIEMYTSGSEDWTSYTF